MSSDEQKTSIGPDVAAAIAVDAGAGDFTAPGGDAEVIAGAQIVADSAVVVGGEEWVNEVFSQLDDEIQVDWYVGDGGFAEAGDVICKLVGRTGPMRTGERTALNYLRSMSTTSDEVAKFSMLFRIN